MIRCGFDAHPDPIPQGRHSPTNSQGRLVISLHSNIQYGIIIFINPNIIGVRFTKVGKIYHFDTSAVPDVGVGEHVIVDTSRGKHLGEVVQLVQDAPDKPEGGWRSVERRATPRDLLLLQSWQAKQTEAMINCRARAAELGLHGVKIVAAEYNFDGSRLALLFSTESEEKVDLEIPEKGHAQPVSQLPD